MNKIDYLLHSCLNLFNNFDLFHLTSLKILNCKLNEYTYLNLNKVRFIKYI